MAMSVLPNGPPLLVPQSTITPSQEQRQGACCLQDAMGPAQGYLNPYIYWGQSQQPRQSTQLQAETPFQSLFTMVENMEADVATKFQSQLRAQRRQSRRYGEYNVWPSLSATPHQIRPCRQVLQASHPGNDVPAFLRLAGTNPGPLTSQNYFYEVLSFTLLRNSRPGHGDTPESDTAVFHHTHFIAVPPSTYVQEFM
ncbi:hypothetical protein BJV77DRAFT_989915 [Russula vinacea]|nr:hypothetical protein BJV77DRAFT_989915 [Russula vinacea]